MRSMGKYQSQTHVTHHRLDIKQPSFGADAQLCPGRFGARGCFIFRDKITRRCSLMETPDTLYKPYIVYSLLGRSRWSTLHSNCTFTNW